MHDIIYGCTLITVKTQKVLLILLVCSGTETLNLFKCFRIKNNTHREVNKKKHRKKGTRRKTREMSMNKAFCHEFHFSLYIFFFSFFFLSLNMFYLEKNTIEINLLVNNCDCSKDSVKQY